MSTRSLAMIAMPLGASSLVGCASTPSSLPAPHGVSAAGVTIKVDLRLPLQAWLKSADAMATTVYFVKDCPPPDLPCDEKLIPSNHESQGRVDLLNAEPGEYRPVAAAYETAVYYVIGTSHVVNIVYFPEALVSATGVQVQAGSLSDAGCVRADAAVMRGLRATQKVGIIQSCLTTHSSQRRFAARLNSGVWRLAQKECSA